MDAAGLQITIPLEGEISVTSVGLPSDDPRIADLLGQRPELADLVDQACDIRDSRRSPLQVYFRTRFAALAAGFDL